MATRSGTRQPASRNSIVIAIGVAAIVAIALVAGALLLRDDGGSGSSAPAVDVSGVPQEGSLLGDPDASVTLIEYADMQCPFCAEYTEQMLPTLVNDYVRPGKVNADFRVVSILGATRRRPLATSSPRASRTSCGSTSRSCSGTRDRRTRAGSRTRSCVESAAAVPGLDVDRLFTDAESAEVTAQALRNMQGFQESGATGTPTLLVQIGDDDPYLIQVGLDPAALSAALDDALSG